MTTVLVVEDEKLISEGITAYLQNDGYQVLQAYDGEEALQLFGKHPVNVVVLDLMLPKISGEEVCKRIRSRSNTPILMLTAKTELTDKISGFRLGADDYLAKPFEPLELMERIRALLRRSESGTPKASILAFFDNTLLIDLEQMTVKKNGDDIVLTANEFRILKTLLSNPNKIFTREEIIEIAFGIGYDGFDRAIDTHIKNIRAKLEDDPKHPKLIKTVYGMGYRAGNSHDLS